MDNTSYWLDSAGLPRFPSLASNVTVDVAIVGGGITGITTAYLLKKNGYRVALLERERCCRIDTGHTTAHLTCVTDQRLHRLAKTFGKDRARAAWEAGLAAIDQIAANIKAEDIACDFRWAPGFLHDSLTKPDADTRSLERDAELARELGFQAEFMEHVPWANRPGIRFENQAEFHPLKYLAGLLKAIEGDGCHVYEKTEATEFLEAPVAIKTGKGRVRADYLVLATHNPLMGLKGLVSATLFQTKLFLYTSYALGAKVPQGILPQALFWDTSEPYYYVRVERKRGFDYVIFGGEDHKTGQEADTEKCYRRLGAVLKKVVPQAEVTHRWSGQVIETNDGLPFIGETAKQQFAATGFAGNGMTFGTMGAMMAVDAYMKRKNPWTDLFAPNRKKVRGGTWHYLKENKDYPYYLVRDRFGGGESKSLSMVKRGQGKILNLDGHKVAAYRDETGQVTLRSPVCTHMKCIVAWNDAEKTWDCPCHGSRFKPNGEVISGPAEEALAEAAADSAVKSK